MEVERRKRTWISYARYSRDVVQRGEANESSPSAIDEKGELLDMAKVEHAQLSVTQGGNWFVFTLDWRCSFVPEETNFVFDTNWSLKEDDGGGGDDDFITSDVSPHVHSAHSDVKQFRPVAAHPTNDPRLAIFQETRQWHRSNVDTELFEGEEVYAFVHLRNVTQDFFTPGLRSNTLNLNP